jgi:two-component system OmpR family sensor kinase
MRSLRVKFALLAGSVGLFAVVTAAGLFWALAATDQAVERTLSAQARLDRVAELSGRLTQYGLAAVDVAGAGLPPADRLQGPRAELERALAGVAEHLGDAVAERPDLLGRTEAAGRSRMLARLRASVGLLDAQIQKLLREPEPSRRVDEVRGALNGFGAITGPALSFLVEAERRAVEAASSEAKALSAWLRKLVLMVAAAALVGVVVVSRAITRPLLTRIEAIRTAASGIGHGASRTRIPVRERDELGLLIASFNRMAARLARRERRLAADRARLEETVAGRTADLRAANDRLAAIDQSRRRFFADVSHELRTPLTVILGECDLAARNPPATPPEVRSLVGTIRGRALRLQRRVQDLLRVARSESGQIELDRRPVSAVAVLSEAVESCTLEAERHRVVLDFDPGQHDVEILADPEWLRQVVEGLIDNALRHGQGATRIAVRLAAGPRGASISVSDDGPGFPEAADRLLTRFARAGARSDAAGFGIGLALAAWIVEHHGGTIRLQNAGREGGAEVILDMPALIREDAA